MVAAYSIIRDPVYRNTGSIWELLFRIFQKSVDGALAPSLDLPGIINIVGSYIYKQDLPAASRPARLYRKIGP